MGKRSLRVMERPRLVLEQFLGLKGPCGAGRESRMHAEIRIIVAGRFTLQGMRRAFRTASPGFCMQDVYSSEGSAEQRPSRSPVKAGHYVLPTG